LTEYKEALYKLIGERIKSQRESLGLSQLELSKKLDLSRSSVSNIELGRHQIPLHILYEISKVCNVNIDYFLPNNDEIVSLATSEVSDYIKFLNSSKLEDGQKQKLKDFLKNI
jgi:transcriptional regulator with XRE-family HTH domain